MKQNAAFLRCRFPRNHQVESRQLIRQPPVYRHQLQMSLSPFVMPLLSSCETGLHRG